MAGGFLWGFSRKGPTFQLVSGIIGIEKETLYHPRLDHWIYEAICSKDRRLARDSDKGSSTLSLPIGWKKKKKGELWSELVIMTKKKNSHLLGVQNPRDFSSESNTSDIFPWGPNSHPSPVWGERPSAVSRLFRCLCLAGPCGITSQSPGWVVKSSWTPSTVVKK